MKRYQVTVNGETFNVDVAEVGGAAAPVIAPAAVPAPAPAPAPVAAPAPAPAPAAAPPAPAAGGTVNSPLPGTILRINVSVGQAVKAGDVLLVLEAMKMENDITASGDGVVSAIHVETGTAVQSGDALVSL